MRQYAVAGSLFAVFINESGSGRQYAVPGLFVNETAATESVGGIRRREAMRRLARRREREIRELRAQEQQVKAQIAAVKDQPKAKAKWIALEDVGQALQAPTLPALTLRLAGIVERVQQLEARLAMILAAIQAEEEEEEAVLLLL